MPKINKNQVIGPMGPPGCNDIEMVKVNFGPSTFDVYVPIITDRNGERYRLEYFAHTSGGYVPYFVKLKEQQPTHEG